MFKKETYIERRRNLKKMVGSGIILFLGNQEASFNYPANTYTFRQDSTFLYFFGLNNPGLAAIIDIDEDAETLYGYEYDMDDIIWMGPQANLAARAEKTGIRNVLPIGDLERDVKKIAKKRKIHFVHPYRGSSKIWLSELLEIPVGKQKENASEDLIKAIVELRAVKEKQEIDEIEKAIGTAYKMHTTAMRLAKSGVVEREIAGTIEGIALANGGPVSFPVILSVNGQTLHNHYHGNTLKKGRMLIVDAGCETEMGYASDITRCVPVDGVFDQRQKDIYQIVLNANMAAINAIKPDMYYKDIHILAAKEIVKGLKNIGIMRGYVDDAVEQGAHALFFPHGLGHMLGLDVHDMENLGENYVGYDKDVQRSQQFGLAFLRMARRLKEGFVMTVEPGIYFIPALIDQWKNERRFIEFIDYEKVDKFKDFGGIRLEDDVLVTRNSFKVLGKPIPKTIQEVEETATSKLV